MKARGVIFLPSPTPSEKTILMPRLRAFIQGQILTKEHEKKKQLDNGNCPFRSQTPIPRRRLAYTSSRPSVIPTSTSRYPSLSSTCQTEPPNPPPPLQTDRGDLSRPAESILVARIYHRVDARGRAPAAGLPGGGFPAQCRRGGAATEWG